jgi:hypothetical protein
MDMDAKLRLERLFRWAFARPAPHTIDAAEVGTAYGMELSIDAARQSAAAHEGRTNTQEPPGSPSSALQRSKCD